MSVSERSGPAANEPDSGEPFGARLRRLRTERGLRQRDLAGEHVSASYVSFLESGRRAPTQRVTRHLAERLGCDPEALWTPAAVDDARREAAALELRLARLALLAGRTEEAARLVDGVEADPGGDHRLLRRARFGLAQICEAAGRLDEAAARYAQCLADADDRCPFTLTATVGLVRSLAGTGERARALTLLAHARQQVAEAGLAVSDLAVELCTIGAGLYAEAGDPAAAEELVDAALTMIGPVTDPGTLVETYRRAAQAACAAGRPGRAAELAERGTDAGVERDRAGVRGMLQAVHGALLLRRQPPQLDRAGETLLRASADLQASGGHGPALARCHNDLAQVLVLTDRPDEAAALADRVAADDAAGGLERVRARLLSAAARIALGDPAAARTRCREAAAALDPRPGSTGTARLWSDCAELLVAAGDVEAAIGAYQRAVRDLGLHPEAGAVARR
jgi:transcriptional regulator with XRE-family HTH domain